MTSCAFEACSDVLAAGAPGCAMVGGCIPLRFGNPPRPKPTTPVRRRQRPQARLFGEAVGKSGRRKRERAGGGPRPAVDLGRVGV
jgi:hypothetical protein